jgi:hypothetical protein
MPDKTNPKTDPSQPMVNIISCIEIEMLLSSDRTTFIRSTKPTKLINVAQERRKQ